MTRFRLALAACLLSLPAFADEPLPAPLPLSLTVNDDKPVTVEVGKKCVLTASTGAKKVTWRIPAGVDAVPLDGKRLAVWATEGTYSFGAAIPNGDEVIFTEIVLTVTGPRPPPKPPEPKPDAPIDAPGFHVLIIYQDKIPLPKEQHTIIYGKAVRDYLNAKCAKEPSGNSGWRIWDQDLDVSLAPKHFQIAHARNKVKALPYLVVSDGVSGWEGPLPATAEETMAILKRFGGE